MTLKTWMLALAAAVSLTACGGGDPGTSPFGSGSTATDASTTSKATAVDVLASTTQIGTGGSEAATITVAVKGAGSVALADAPVTLVASSGSLVVSASKTNTSGLVTATLTPGSTAAGKANRVITVTATSGTASGSVNVQVVGTTAAYSGATSLSQSTAASSFQILVKDSKGGVIEGARVTASASQLGNALSATEATTDANGAATFNYTPSTAGSDTLTFSVLGATVSSTLSISGQDFAFVSPASGSSVTVGASQTVTVRYRVNGVPQVGQTVNFASTAGTFSTATSVTTNGSGQASATLSSSFAGSASVSASISGVGTTTLPLSFVAVVPTSVVLQVNPAAISPNTNGNTTQQATVLARVTDASGNPVSNTVVDFSRIADPSGGNLSAASAQTDANGEASVKYIAGPNSTSSGGVILRGTVQGTTVKHDAQLTVNQSALFIALGTGNVITNVDEQTYQKSWTAYVTDSNGVAVPGVTLTFRLLPVMYAKGSMTFVAGEGWQYGNYSGSQSTSTTLPAGNALWCPNEDLDADGILDRPVEDNTTTGTGNGNNALEPGNVVALKTGTSNLVTDANGRATINIQYAESYAPWVYVTLQATATVTGTESKKDASFVIPALSSDLTNQAIPPAGRVSPFGTIASCASPN